MKKMLFFLLMPSLVFSQPPSLFKVTKDRFTGNETKELIKPITWENSKTSLIWINLNELQGFQTLGLIIADKTFGCTSEQHHEIYFLFEDGTRYKAYNSATGCKGYVFVYMTNGPAMNERLPRLLEMDNISAVRIESDNGNFEADVPKTVALKIKEAALEFFGGKKSGMGIPLDSSAAVPKKATVRAPSAPHP